MTTPFNEKACTRTSWLFSGFLVILLTACTAVGPDYVPPVVPVPDRWNAKLEGGLVPERLDPKVIARWWSILNDPTLINLIERAVEGNPDLHNAQARVREARAQRAVSKADRFPTIDATGSASSNRSSKETGSGTRSELYTAGFDSSWELDLFGGIRRSIEATQAALEASEEDLRDVLVTLLAEVALNYVEVCSFQARLAIAEANLGAQAETYRLTQWRFEAGLTTQLDIEQAKSSLEETRAQIPIFQIELEQTKNQLAILLGQNPGSLEDKLSGCETVPVTSLEVAVGIPANVLRRRPDVRRAERQLAAQTARVGVVTAELYPKFSLLGSIGLEALSFGNLFMAGNRTYGIASEISWAVFDAGRIRQNIAVQNALQEQALIEYEASVLTAVKEVEDTLVAYVKEQVRRRSLAEASQAAQNAVDLAHDQYASGIIDFTTVLDAQRTLLTLQDQLVESNGKITSNLISLFKALGGGWTSFAPVTSYSLMGRS